MNLLDIILLAMALAMDCFTVSIVTGVIAKSGQWTVDSYDYQTSADSISSSNHNCPLSTIHCLHSKLSTLNYQLPLLFGLFQALMPLIGWLGTSYFSVYLEAIDHWIAFGLLAFIGGNMIKESLEPKEEPHFNPTLLKTQLILAVATSIDALAVGISFACTGYRSLAQLVLPLSVIGLVSFLFSLLGYQLGRRFGMPIARRLKPELLGGIILILIGIKILVTHLATEA